MAAASAYGLSGQGSAASKTSSLSRLLNGFSLRSRNRLFRDLQFAPRTPDEADMAAPATLVRLARDLISGRGEASGVALATDFVSQYEMTSPAERIEFFRRLGEEFSPDRHEVEAAFEAFRQAGPSALPRLSRATEAPRQEFFRRLNLAPHGTAALVRMREDLLAYHGRLEAADLIDGDLVHLLQSWFNRGFLTMREISWDSPASLLEKLIRYEAVHDIHGWEDLRSRLHPSDRRCFAFFHPALPEEPLIFVEVALCRRVPGAIQDVLDPGRTPLPAEQADTAVFYSISNCQPGLRGVSLGHFLIKQVVTDLRHDLPRLRRFVTLSPVPGFMKWLSRADPELGARVSRPSEGWRNEGDVREKVIRHAIAYFTRAKTANGKPLDPVARFHLGNGARLEQLNWLGDTSAKGLEQAAGLMVNYCYDLPRIEEYHEAFAHSGQVILGRPMRDLAKSLRDRAPKAKRKS